jgi:hypothetical protein
MTQHLPLRRLGLTIVAAVFAVGAPAVHAFTMDTIANSNGGAKYVDPSNQFEELAKGKTTTAPSGNGLQFSVGPSDRSSPGSRIGPPPDQSRFNDR